MDLETAIKTRRSVRQFTSQEVPNDLLEKIIGAAVWAPSACNIQGWRFIIVSDSRIRDQLVENGGSVVIKNSPVGILVVYDNRTTNLEYKDYIQSASASINSLILAAHSYGLGSCWICHLPPKRILRKIFNIPPSFSPIAYVMLGYAKNQPREMPRSNSLGEIIGHNTFSFKIPPAQPKAKLFATRLMRAVYFRTPKFFKKIFLNKFIDKKFVKKFEN